MRKTKKSNFMMKDFYFTTAQELQATSFEKQIHCFEENIGRGYRIYVTGYHGFKISNDLKFNISY